MTEYFDVLTEDGTPTGEVLSKDEVHNRGLWHGSVHAWVVNSSGQLLLAQRAHTKVTDPGLWDMAVCGHLNTGENAIQAAIREGREEIGIDLTNADFDEMLVYIRTNEHPFKDGSIRYERLVTPTLLVRTNVDLDTLTLEPREVAAVRWIELDELNQTITNPPHPFAIRPGEWAELLPHLKTRIS